MINRTNGLDTDKFNLDLEPPPLPVFINRNLSRRIYEDETLKVITITLEILSHLRTLADRIIPEKRRVRQIPRINTHSSPFLNKKGLQNGEENDRNGMHRSSSFPRETNFEGGLFYQNVRIGEIIYNIFYAIKNILFGIDPTLDPNLKSNEIDPRPLESIKREITTDKTVWKSLGEEEHYLDNFKETVDNNLDEGLKLIKSKETYYQTNFSQRITFYASLIILCIGKLTDHRFLKISAFVLSTITVFYMLSSYRKAVVEQTQSIKKILSFVKTAKPLAYTMLKTDR